MKEMKGVCFLFTETGTEGGWWAMQEDGFVNEDGYWSYNGQHAKDYMGEFFRRICRKLGKPQAITATAHKLARIVYHLLSTREAYDESVFHKCEEEALKRAEMRLRRQAAHLGFRIIPAEEG